MTRSRVRALGSHALAAGVATAAVARLYATGGYAVAPGSLLACPLHVATGLWCPFCGGLRCVAALSHGDVAAALSFNVVVLALIPLVTGLWVRSTVAAARGSVISSRGVTNRGWAVLLAVLLVFTLWRNLPALPLAGYLAP